MNLLDEYRRNARECQRMADNARNPTDKASWLRLAASWLGMIKGEPRQPFAQEPKQDAAAKRGGRVDARWPTPSDDDSQASH